MSKCAVIRLTPLMCELILSGQLYSKSVKNTLFGVSNAISFIEYVNALKIAAFIVTFDMFKGQGYANLSCQGYGGYGFSKNFY